MCWPWQKKRCRPLLLFKRTEKIVWEKADAAMLRSFVEGPVGQKLLARMDDKLINGILQGLGRNVVLGFKLCVKEIYNHMGENPKVEIVDADISDEQFQDKED